MARSENETKGLLSGAVVLEKEPSKALVYRVKLGRAAVRARSSEEALLKQAFRSALTAPAAKDIRVAAEGDSWCNIVWPFSGYPPTFVDLIDDTPGYYVANIGWPGDEFADILAAKQYRQLLGSNSFNYFVFSGGGNDIIGGKALKDFLKPRASLGADPAPADCLHAAKFEQALTTLGRGYRTLAKEVKTWTTRTKMLIHGYDHAIPRQGGKWLGGPFAERGYAPTGALAKAIIVHMVDRYYEALEAVAAEAGSRVILVDCRGACAGNWHDELHPNKTAAKKVAARFLDKMGGAPILVAGG